MEMFSSKLILKEEDEEEIYGRVLRGKKKKLGFVIAGEGKRRGE